MNRQVSPRFESAGRVSVALTGWPRVGPAAFGMHHDAERPPVVASAAQPVSNNKGAVAAEPAQQKKQRQHRLLRSRQTYRGFLRSYSASREWQRGRRMGPSSSGGVVAKKSCLYCESRRAIKEFHKAVQLEEDDRKRQGLPPLPADEKPNPPKRSNGQCKELSAEEASSGVACHRKVKRSVLGS